VLLAVLAANYFQVAESKIGVSQVIAVSMWLARPFMHGIELLPGCGIPGHQWPPSGVDRSQRSWVIGLLPGCGIPGHFRSPLRWWSATSRWRNRRWRCPRSSVVLSQWGASYFQVADSDTVLSQVMRFFLSGGCGGRSLGSCAPVARNCRC